MNLEEAAEAGDLERVKYLVENGADIYTVDYNALSSASRYGHLEVVKYLVEKGADIHADIEAALVLASRYGHLDIVKYLVEKGANIHAGNDWALIWSSRFGHLEVVKFLVEHAANIHANDDEALIFASRYGHLDVVKYLIENGADWTKLHKDVLPELIKEKQNNLKEKLTKEYLLLERGTPQVTIGDKTKSYLPKNLLLNTVYQNHYNTLCSAIDQKVPPLGLIALANILKIDYNIDISWINLCDKVKKALYLML